jgi:ribosomal protein S8
MTDPVSDLLARIRNAGQARHAEIICPSSKLKLAVAKVLVANGYLDTVSVEARKASRCSASACATRRMPLPDRRHTACRSRASGATDGAHSERARFSAWQSCDAARRALRPRGA